MTIRCWEYREDEDLSPQEKNELGAKGWELVSAETVERQEGPESHPVTYYYFKRELRTAETPR